MEGPTHDLNALCQQLGLPSEAEALQAFISQHQGASARMADKIIEAVAADSR